MVDASKEGKKRRKTNDTYRACATMILKNGWCLFPKRERRIRTTILTCFVWYRGLENNRIEVLPERFNSGLRGSWTGIRQTFIRLVYQKRNSAIKAVGCEGWCNQIDITNTTTTFKGITRQLHLHSGICSVLHCSDGILLLHFDTIPEQPRCHWRYTIPCHTIRDLSIVYEVLRTNKPGNFLQRRRCAGQGPHGNWWMVLRPAHGIGWIVCLAGW